MLVTRQGYELDPAAAPEHVRRVKTELRVALVDRSGLDRAYKTYIQAWWTDPRTRKMVVPRFYGQQALDRQARDERDPPLVVPPPRMQFRGGLRADLDQPAAVEAVMRSLRATGGGVLSLRTGGGKTCVALYIAAQLGLKTVVLVHKDVLRAQWADRIAQFLPGARVSFVQGTVNDTSGDVVIAMLQTLTAPGRAFDWRGVGLVCVDEAHHIAAETFATAMRGLNAQYTLGLSATPERKDGLTCVVHWFLGPLAYAAKAEVMRHVTVRTLRYDHPRYRAPLPHTAHGTINYAQVVTDIADDDVRTGVIVDAIARLRAADPGRVVLVLSHRRAHCTDLAARIPGAVAFLGGAPKKKHKTTAAGDDQPPHTVAPVVCATYALASEGYDDARLDTLVLATPCSDVTQAAGRVLRGAANPVILDIQDDFSVAYAQSAKRRAQYKKAGFVITTAEKKEFPRCMILD